MKHCPLMTGCLCYSPLGQDLALVHISGEAALHEPVRPSMDCQASASFSTLASNADLNICVCYFSFKMFFIMCLSAHLCGCVHESGVCEGHERVTDSLTPE